MALTLMRRLWREEAWLRPDRQPLILAVKRRLAHEVLTQRMPLDADIFGEIARRAPNLGLPSQSQLARLERMWPRLDETGLVWLRENRARLSPLLQRMVETRGIPAQGVRLNKCRSPPAARSLRA